MSVERNLLAAVARALAALIEDSDGPVVDSVEYAELVRAIETYRRTFEGVIPR